ncbi:MAG: alpha/beta fold hydrolase [Deltaproteobacteria bacterium]|nr:alpha/beta fold hydrolase [Deltaproteobacteria bacterium]
MEARVLAELPRFLLATRRLDHLPRGDGHAVVVVPGWGLDDTPTLPMRLALGRLGYAVHGWGLGRNVGAGRRAELAARFDRRLAELHDIHGGPVSLVGWSLGGVVAREAARRQPRVVRRVVSLGSPINGDPAANNVTTFLRLIGRDRASRAGSASRDAASLAGSASRDAASLDRKRFEERRAPPPVACIAVHTKTDGVVAWRCSLEEPAPHTDNVEVRGSHAGLIVNVEVLAVLAHHLPRPPWGGDHARG